MSAPGSLTWFAQHEARIAWREALAMMTAGRRDREKKVAVGVLIFLCVMHVVAYFAIGKVAQEAYAKDLHTLIGITAALILSGSAILSQAMEGVTRTFYTRSDLELILSSPTRVHRLFAVRIGAIALSIGAMSLLFIGPFIDVLAWQGSATWLSAYGVIISVSLTATAIAIALTAAMFEIIGPKRTRLIAQIAAAVIGGAFVIGLQVSAMFSTGTLSRLAFLQSDYVLSHAPALGGFFWWPARAALGDVGLMLGGIVASLAVFIGATLFYAPRFATYALAASGISHGGVNAQDASRAFRVESASSALRRKERLLLIRDPWLMSQSLMQLLYLVPPALLLWHNYGAESGAAIVAVPVLVMAAGQFAGGLGWLTMSGEDAPDLVLTAPVPPSRILRAKIEAVLQCIAVVFAPFVGALTLYSPRIALVAICGIAASATAATMIQSWFRTHTKRSHFQRRHTSSRIATLSEALSSISWAGACAVAATGSWLAIIPLLIALAILAGVRSLSPRRSGQ